MRTRPSRDDVLMKMAEVQAERSTCARAQVGVVIARDGRVLATGYNGAPAGLPHCDHSQDDVEELSASMAGGTIATHFTGPGCRTAVHAEANAVAYAARYGMALDGSVLYTTYTPCLACAQLVINSGIREVRALKPYRDTAGRDLLITAGVSMSFAGDVR